MLKLIEHNGIEHLIETEIPSYTTTTTSTDGKVYIAYFNKNETGAIKTEVKEAQRWKTS